MNKHWPLSFGFLGVILGVTAAIAFNMKQDSKDEGPHYHAGFQVYVDNELQDFSDLKYMKLNPCSDHHAEDLTPAQEQEEKAHLHDANGDVAHSHRDNVTWGDLFTNTQYEFPDDARISYVNGEKIDGDILDYVLKADDSVVIFVGTNTNINSKLDDAVTLDRIREVEGLSEDCGLQD